MDKLLKFLGGAVITLLGGFSSLILTVTYVNGLCDNKTLPFSFCNEITGAVNIARSGILVATLTMVVTAVYLIRRKY